MRLILPLLQDAIPGDGLDIGLDQLIGGSALVAILWFAIRLINLAVAATEKRCTVAEQREAICVEKFHPAIETISKLTIALNESGNGQARIEAKLDASAVALKELIEHAKGRT